MSDLSRGRGRGIHPLVAVTALVAVSIVAMLTLAPRAIVAPARHAFLRAADEILAPLTWLPSADAERVLNTVMFVPLGIALALLLSRRAWPVAVSIGLLVSAGVEFAQGSIPGRVTDLADVFWNTAGTAIGVGIVLVVRGVASAHRRARRAASRARRDISRA